MASAAEELSKLLLPSERCLASLDVVLESNPTASYLLLLVQNL